MDETTAEVTTEQTQQVSTNLQTERDPVREAERELGYEELSLSAEESAENASYLATVAMFGNRMMLEILQTRLNAGKKAIGKDSNEFQVIKELMGGIVAAYEEVVNKDNFPTKYGNMLEKYGQLGGACKMYLSSHAGRRKTKEGAGRVHHVEQIGQVVEREMQIIRARSGVLARSETGMSWKEMFASEGRMEIAQNQRNYAANHPSEQGEQGESSNQREEPADPAASSLEAQVQRLQNQVQKLQDRLDAPKLKVLTEEEKAIWRGVEMTGNQAPTLMTAERFRALLTNTALEGNDLEPADVERIATLLEKLHHRDAHGESAPVFSKRLLEQLLQVSAPKEETSDVLRLISGQCRAAQSYQPPELSDTQTEQQPEAAQQEAQEEPAEDSARSPFLKPDGTLNDAGEILNQRLMPQLKGLPVNWAKVRLIFNLLKEHRAYAITGEAEVLDRLERDIVTTIGEGRTYPALEELREACTKIRQGRVTQAPEEPSDSTPSETPSSESTPAT